MWANEDQFLVLCSAGNSNESQGPPGIAKNVLCVAASKQDVIALGDGSAGPTLDGRRRPDLMMIGCGVITADVGSGCEVAPRDECASSYATPYAAAAAALVRQYLMEGRHPTGKPRPEHSIIPTGALLKAVLLNATLPPQDRSAHPSDAMGWGLGGPAACPLLRSRAAPYAALGCAARRRRRVGCGRCLPGHGRRRCRTAQGVPGVDRPARHDRRG